jgi:predicted O-methyltransferase YrrM
MSAGLAQPHADPRHATWRPMLEGHFADHEALRRRFGIEPDTTMPERVLACYRPPPWAEGSVGVLDAMALRDAVHGLRPHAVIEIGTAAGTSALVLARAMLEAGCAAPGAVHTFDLHPWCYFDRSRPVGAAIDEAEPEARAVVEASTGATALDAGRLLAGRGLTLAFIDADHRHPMPALDVLALRPALAPGAWIVLHDIDLPAQAERYERRRGVRVDWRQHGAKHLFDAWPFEKLALPLHTNIGLIRLPADRPVRPEDLRPCLDRPWEIQPPARDLALLELPTGDPR